MLICHDYNIFGRSEASKWATSGDKLFAANSRRKERTM